MVVGVYLRDEPIESDIGTINLHPSKGTLWVARINEVRIDCYGCSPFRNLYRFIVKRNGLCLYSEYKIRGLTSKRDSYCAAYCLYIIYLTEVLRIAFKSAVVSLYYQMIQECWRFHLKKWHYENIQMITVWNMSENIAIKKTRLLPFLKNETKTYPKLIKSFIKNLTAEGFVIIKWIMKCYFFLKYIRIC